MALESKEIEREFPKMKAKKVKKLEEMKSISIWERVFETRKKTIMKKAKEIEDACGVLITVTIRLHTGLVYYYSSSPAVTSILKKSGLLGKQAFNMVNVIAHAPMLNEVQRLSVDRDERSKPAASVSPTILHRPETSKPPFTKIQQFQDETTLARNLTAHPTSDNHLKTSPVSSTYSANRRSSTANRVPGADINLVLPATAPLQHSPTQTCQRNSQPSANLSSSSDSDSSSSSDSDDDSSTTSDSSSEDDNDRHRDEGTVTLSSRNPSLSKSENGTTKAMRNNLVKNTSKVEDAVNASKCSKKLASSRKGSAKPKQTVQPMKRLTSTCKRKLVSSKVDPIAKDVSLELQKRSCSLGNNVANASKEIVTLKQKKKSLKKTYAAEPNAKRQSADTISDHISASASVGDKPSILEVPETSSSDSQSLGCPQKLKNKKLRKTIISDVQISASTSIGDKPSILEVPETSPSTSQSLGCLQKKKNKKLQKTLHMEKSASDDDDDDTIRRHLHTSSEEKSMSNDRIATKLADDVKHVTARVESPPVPLQAISSVTSVSSRKVIEIKEEIPDHDDTDAADTECRGRDKVIAPANTESSVASAKPFKVHTNKASGVASKSKKVVQIKEGSRETIEDVTPVSKSSKAVSTKDNETTDHSSIPKKLDPESPVPPDSPLVGYVAKLEGVSLTKSNSLDRIALPTKEEDFDRNLSFSWPPDNFELHCLEEVSKSNAAKHVTASSSDAAQMNENVCSRKRGHDTAVDRTDFIMMKKPNYSRYSYNRSLTPSHKENFQRRTVYNNKAPLAGRHTNRFSTIQQNTNRCAVKQTANSAESSAKLATMCRQVFETAFSDKHLNSDAKLRKHCTKMESLNIPCTIVNLLHQQVYFFELEKVLTRSGYVTNQQRRNVIVHALKHSKSLQVTESGTVKRETPFVSSPLNQNTLPNNSTASKDEKLQKNNQSC